ncbi:MAG: protein jag [Negativicutes bacterium]|nr:protein jag [Negativicutes bacterium]
MMMATVEKEGKTIEEAVELALSELSAREEDVDIEVLVPPSKGFLGIGARLARVRVSDRRGETAGAVAGDSQVVLASQAGRADAGAAASRAGQQGVAAAKDFLQAVFRAMGIPVSLEKLRSKEAVVLNLRGENLGVLIGKHGQTLDALQYLTGLVVNRRSDGEERTRIILDVEDYRRRRHDTLKKLAVRLAAQVKREGVSKVLEPMSSQERKVIHTTLQADRLVTTVSEGEEPRRKVVISPVNAAGREPVGKYGHNTSGGRAGRERNRHRVRRPAGE